MHYRIAIENTKLGVRSRGFFFLSDFIVIPGHVTTNVVCFATAAYDTQSNVCFPDRSLYFLLTLLFLDQHQQQDLRFTAHSFLCAFLHRFGLLGYTVDTSLWVSFS